MLAELSKALDDCLERRLDGESLESCLNDYPELRARLEPLLTTAAFVSAAPKVSPSEGFRVASQARLMVRLHERSRQRKSARAQRGEGLLKAVGTACRKLIQALNKPLPLAVPVTLLLLLAAGGSISVIAGIGLPGQPSALASQCTVSVLGGSAQVQLPGSDTWQMAGDGMVLAAGTRVRTAPDSHAMLTFFEGSSLTLEPGTDVEIQSVEGSGGSSTDIVLKQWVGKTWSRVVKRLDADTRYEIITPSACALVRGTLFETEVGSTLSTTVRTTEGLVSVVAQGKEVFLPAGQEASAEPGAAPSEPRPITPAANELLITVGLPAVASVCDPGGASVGYLPDGFAFNQIPGAQSTSPGDGVQVIRVPNPVPGEYSLVLRSAVGGVSQVSLVLQSAGQPVFTHADAYRVPRGSEWLVPFSLKAEDGGLIDVEVGDIQPLNGQSPENLIRPAATVAPTASAEATLEPTQPAPSLSNYTLSLVSSDGGSVVQPGQGVFLFHAGAVVTIVAEADAGWVFDRWVGDVENISAPATTVKMSKPQAIAAIFVRQT
jgi:hypothetical protein